MNTTSTTPADTTLYCVETGHPGKLDRSEWVGNDGTIGQEDGSGELVVWAESAMQYKFGVVFRAVHVIAKGKYAEASRESLLAEATAMLGRAFCK